MSNNSNNDNNERDDRPVWQRLSEDRLAAKGIDISPPPPAETPIWAQLSHGDIAPKRPEPSTFEGHPEPDPAALEGLAAAAGGGVNIIDGQLKVPGDE